MASPRAAARVLSSRPARPYSRWLPRRAGVAALHNVEQAAPRDGSEKRFDRIRGIIAASVWLDAEVEDARDGGSLRSRILRRVGCDPMRLRDQVVQVEPELLPAFRLPNRLQQRGRASRVVRDPRWLPFAHLDTGRREFDQRLEQVGRRAPPPVRMPERLPDLVRFPVIPGIEKRHTSEVLGRARPIAVHNGLCWQRSLARPMPLWRVDRMRPGAARNEAIGRQWFVGRHRCLHPPEYAKPRGDDGNLRVSRSLPNQTRALGESSIWISKSCLPATSKEDYLHKTIS